MNSAPLKAGALAAVEGLAGTFAVIDWDASTVKLRSRHGVEFRAGRRAVRVLDASSGRRRKHVA